MRASPELRASIRARAFPPPAPRATDAAAIARHVAESGGDGVLGVVFYGSRKTAARPDRWSAYDFFVLTADYPTFYCELRAHGRFRGSARLAAALNAVLPPNQVSILAEHLPGSPLAKCSVVSLAAFERDTSARRRDHFCAGRLFQPTEAVWVRDDAVAERLLDAMVSAHVETYGWVRPWLPPSFDVETYCRTLLRVSLGGEFRPEPPGRAETLFAAQREYLTAVYSILLGDLTREGELVAGGDGYRLVRAATAKERRSVQRYFRRSKFRATARWLKYTVTFDNWLDYIVHKAQRHMGDEIVLTDRERRMPLLFLWPRVIRYFRRKGARPGRPGA